MKSACTSAVRWQGRLDPRPFLKIWEPRYRKFLEVATELHKQMEGEDARAAAESLREQFDAADADYTARSGNLRKL